MEKVHDERVETSIFDINSAANLRINPDEDLTPEERKAKVCMAF